MMEFLQTIVIHQMQNVIPRLATSMLFRLFFILMNLSCATLLELSEKKHKIGLL